MATYIDEGYSIAHTPSSAVSAGEVVVQNDLVGVAKLAIAANVLGSLTVRGVFDFPKATGGGSAIAAGKKVYWDDTNDVITETSTDNTYAGKTIAAAGDDDATVRVRLEQ